ncbi:hypothetical protein H5410_062618 [Solanum commersonii]|uniref:AAA+ ATPase domain-containing protein n=1 Tax=Solanum commersonii TaxID=4109 RepID=A0A9J5WC22_SOLCO|nr:hypothetical protein H5410_062618 [Solanum commersonii]
MAEILLTAVINKSIEIAGNVLFQEGTRLYWLKEDIDWLQREMRHIQSYIDDAKAKEVGGDSRVKNLLKDIQQLAVDVEDLLDEFLPEIQQSNKFKGAICCLKTVSFADEFAMEIEKIKRRAADIDRVRTTYNIMDTSNNNNDCIPLDQRRLFLHADETEVIGLDDDFNMLQAKLLDHTLPYGVVSIVGMPGLGKTTLAKKLYRHVRHQFDCSGLVYVSQQPRAGEILHDIAKQVGLMEEERKDNLEGNLKSLLKRKRYVILLDDVWDVEIWNYLKLVLPESKIGSRIIITSRNSNVGRYVGGDSSLHVLQSLDSENSFELFAKKIFIFDNDNWANASPDLVNIGRSIVGRCGGIPLAITVIAGMLRAKERTEYSWNRVLESLGHKIQDECAKVLALSYNDLPIALRPCFLYFGLFPEDHEIRAFDLTNMWIAEKLIVVNSGNMREAEDLAEDVLNDLVSRNLIQVAKRTYDGRISSCRIHDLLHSLCVDLGKESYFFHTEHNAFGDLLNVSRVRRITFNSNNIAMIKFFRSNPNPKKLRAFFCFTKDRCIFSKLAHLNFKLLRVLVVVMSQDGYGGFTMGNKFGKMSCLRYLRLEGVIRENLPNTIVKLKCLETIDIGVGDIELPCSVWDFKQLRHVHCREELKGFFSISPNMYSLAHNNVQTLMWMDDKFFEARLLHQLINLRKLGISSASDSTIKMLSALSPVPTVLEVLKLKFCNESSEQINLSSYPNIVKLHLERKMPLNCEAFPPNLVKLTLVYLMVDVHVVAVLKKFPKLRILKMVVCEHKKEEMDLSGDGFPQLEVLHIQNPLWLPGITCTDHVSMPKLNKLLLVETKCERTTFGITHTSNNNDQYDYISLDRGRLFLHVDETEVIEIAGNLLFQEGSRLNWLKEDINWLQREMRHIQSYIDNAKDKAIEGDTSVKNLIKDIQKLAGDVEDLLDEFLPKIQQSNKCKVAICWLKTACIPSHASFADEFAIEIEKIKKRVADIDRVRTTYNIIDTSNNNNDDCIPLDQRRLFLHADETEVIGLDDDFNMLKAKLLDHDLPYGVVSIVGMPGLVYVSQQPRVGEILHDIAKQVGVTEEERKDNLEGNLRSLLKRKRYVILLDDIWDVEIWNYLKLVLPEYDSKIGSRIIVTSQNSNVGRYIGGDFPVHVLQPLDSKNSFELFSKKIFNFENNNNWVNASPDLVNIGRSMVGRCGGVPLAIVVTVGMLRARERTEHAWNKVLESMGHKVQDGCAKVLALSYNDLPIALRPCLLREKEEKKKRRSRSFCQRSSWKSSGLIVVNSGNGLEVESLAEDILNDLVSRNLIQVAKRKDNGRISSCRIHDLLHSLCVELAKESNFFHTEHNAFGDPENIARVRRITFYFDNNAMNEFFRSNPKPTKLCALFCFINDCCLFSDMAHLNFRLLQMLVVVISTNYSCGVSIPKTFWNMSCLRYLRFKGYIYGKLPNSMVKLKCLETIDISNSFIELPTGVWKTTQLTHLRYYWSRQASNGCCSISPVFPNVYLWPHNNLQTLMWMDGKIFEPRLLHRLINLRKLGTKGVSDSTIKLLSALSPVPTALEVLKLRVSRHMSEQINLLSYPNIVKFYLDVYGTIHLNSEAFPPNLVKLTLLWYKVDGHVVAVLKKLPK